ncbi:unnamed protein product, partial [marine sediment metagenome]
FWIIKGFLAGGIAELGVGCRASWEITYELVQVPT